MTDLIEIDGQRALELIDAAVTDRGEDYVYDRTLSGGCSYTGQNDNGELQPGCLVGLALHIAGVPVHKLADLNRLHRGRIYQIAVHSRTEAGERLGFRLDRVAGVVFSTAQYSQDSGASWGEARDRAREAGQ